MQFLKSLGLRRQERSSSPKSPLLAAAVLDSPPYGSCPGAVRLQGLPVLWLPAASGPSLTLFSTVLVSEHLLTKDPV